MAAITSLVAGPAMADAPLMVKAKEKGYPAQSCQYCHGATLPALNERGAWLAAEKKRQKAEAVDVDWLRDYPGDMQRK
jgi:hypothetical protein